jgi:hypothetical protein
MMQCSRYISTLINPEYKKTYYNFNFRNYYLINVLEFFIDDADNYIEPQKEGGVMSKQNCWEFKNCGRESGGAKVDELGICPAKNKKRTDGVYSGKNGGRSCWE